MRPYTLSYSIALLLATLCIAEKRSVTPTPTHNLNDKLVTTTHVVSTIVISATASANTDVSLTDDNTFQRDVLNTTNTFRGQHNASVVTWNTTLAAYATGWASKCIFNHSNPNAYGENIAAGYVTAESAVNDWGEERRSFNFGRPDFSKKTGHFSQLVWKDTRQIGCGRMKCEGKNNVNGWLIVCEYYPRGNIARAFITNVQKQINGPGAGSLDQGFIGSGKRNWPGFQLAFGLAVPMVIFLI